LDTRFSLFNDIIARNNSHGQGLKYVFDDGKDFQSALTQFAYGVMKMGQLSGMHKHPTMDE